MSISGSREAVESLGSEVEVDLSVRTMRSDNFDHEEPLRLAKHVSHF